MSDARPPPTVLRVKRRAGAPAAPAFAVDGLGPDGKRARRGGLADALGALSVEGGGDGAPPTGGPVLFRRAATAVRGLGPGAGAAALLAALAAGGSGEPASAPTTGPAPVVYRQVRTGGRKRGVDGGEDGPSTSRRRAGGSPGLDVVDFEALPDDSDDTPAAAAPYLGMVADYLASTGDAAGATAAAAEQKAAAAAAVRAASAGTARSAGGEGEADDGWVYDLYVAVGSDGDGESAATTDAAVPLTLLSEDDLLVWESGGGGRGSGSSAGHADDDADSNAEDYYGADYPEDEDGEDEGEEWGRGGGSASASTTSESDGGWRPGGGGASSRREIACEEYDLTVGEEEWDPRSRLRAEAAAWEAARRAEDGEEVDEGSDSE